ncbi:unnamed protein product [Kuraishia capsulata CBS 1993]|uniref:RING-type E3 ubiquitin transferase n=1 Tax=Kuraishia capsulata CBS 1993 TaxID=1382522 RepID=W6MFX6_9ASCO|nr:uncharacterized protein KUCA_T00000826001 [Kuraishia capsulata CBS 1993]CDK24859.1 unnamed protein product [Kuraishia capsulata CBS 1993]
MSEPESDNVTFPALETYLTDANAPVIVRANQKDSYFENVLRGKLQNVIQIFKGQRMVHTHPEEITVGAKALYLALTTLLGSKTLGEEYTDLIYVSRNKKRIPKVLTRLTFILSYTVLPYYISRWLRRVQLREEKEEDEKTATSKVKRRLLGFFKAVSYVKAVDVLLNIHIAIFYFYGSYYNFSKRLLGMRYAYGHKVNEQNAPKGNYELLGALIMLQLFLKGVGKVDSVIQQEKLKQVNASAEDDNNDEGDGVFYDAPIQDEDNQFESAIDLSDPDVLPYIPEDSRKCMLCLSYMTNPSCAQCGHFFCWGCILDWCRENPHCPLCRQPVLEQHLLPLR